MAEQASNLGAAELIQSAGFPLRAWIGVTPQRTGEGAQNQSREAQDGWVVRWHEERARLLNRVKDLRCSV